MRCSMTHLPIDGITDAIYDEGEWISWDWINGELNKQEQFEERFETNNELVRIFEEMVELARDYYHSTGRYLQIWGELGELFGKIMLGIDLHPPRQAGSDGRMGNDWIEIKTISPEKRIPRVQVKRAGNFNKLLIVKIDEDFRFKSKLIDRKSLVKGVGKFARASWNNEDS